MNPYIQFQGMQDQQGLAPVFQNISAQQAMQNAALNEQNQQVQQAGMGGQGGGAGANQLAMAMALRKKDPNASSNFGARADMAMNSQASPYLQDQVSQMGSSTSNPFSNYNMGTNGWGNFGE